MVGILYGSHGFIKYGPETRNKGKVLPIKNIVLEQYEKHEILEKFY